MPYQLSDDARATTLRATRVMFPHDGLPDDCYAKVVNQIEADAGGDEDVAATVEAGVAQLDAPSASSSSTPTPSSRCSSATRTRRSSPF